MKSGTKPRLFFEKVTLHRNREASPTLARVYLLFHMKCLESIESYTVILVQQLQIPITTPITNSNYQTVKLTIPNGEHQQRSS